MPKTTHIPLSDLDLEIAENAPGYIDIANIEILRAIAQETLKSQIEGGRLLIARCYISLGYAINLTLVSLGGAGVASGAVANSTTGWLIHPSIAYGLYATAVLSFFACCLSVWGVLPLTLSGVAIHIDDFYDPYYLSGDRRLFQLALVRLFYRSVKTNEALLPKMRKRLSFALLSMAAAPVFGAALAGCLRLFRLTSS